MLYSTNQHCSNVTSCCGYFWYRVVGEWDVSGEYLKCYSVRSVRGREGELARSWVETSDKNMRQMVATLREM